MNSHGCHSGCPFSHYSQHTTPCRHSYLCIQFQLLTKVICSIKDFFIKNSCSIKKDTFQDKNFQLLQINVFLLFSLFISRYNKGCWYSYAKIKGQTISKANYGLLNSPKKRTKCTQDTTLSAFRSFFGRIEETINCFRDLAYTIQAHILRILNSDLSRKEKE